MAALFETDMVETRSSPGSICTESDIKEPFHVHFGAGKIGLGLVLPALEQSGIKYAVINNPRSLSEITAKGSGSHIDINVNGEKCVSKMLVCLDGVSVDELGEKSLVCGTDPDTVLVVIEKATSLSCSLGAGIDKVLFPILDLLPVTSQNERPTLYACENDHKAVEELGSKLMGKVNINCCMIDRICTDRVITKDDIQVKTESYSGSIVLLKPVLDHKYMPFGGEGVLVPKSPEEASFYYDRKYFLVNGMHTTLAFMSLDSRFPTGSTQDSCPLLTWECANSEQQDTIWAWIAARCLTLINKHGIDLLRQTYETSDDETVFNELLDFATTAQERFSSVEDTTGRVLSGGVTNRWQTRLYPVSNFLSEEMDLPLPLVNHFMEVAGITKQEIEDSVALLLGNTRRFCELD
mmetsp:Transcript_2406/g.3564  ORF Transcript_2406/g.3564 Transcript_2406/m.3564 type:complete len:408 (-) Transcript_2406:114-1337(-)|eukprot:CAMPEP_0113953276 /NCGR_PEP_ID=MMETSP1339-20121228/90886_1 /TAXON_ID=94617 /ORGANISM="Fibrocapsa japonica" /LENGTH=407 /DNA_ID=CAMNT_0000961997 /DNA_START=96 /DNA_END=1319 /DNA_ORIENTATION=- /assembly_acc=CAM_ASM_000762